MTVTTYTWMSANDISSATAFRKWAQGIHDAFVNNGWVQTADTGQINLATVTVPTGTSNTPAGYEIFRLDDALQATAPIFVKLEYGRGASTSTNLPAIWFSVGQSTDGAGGLGNVLYARTQQTTQTALGSTSEFPSYASGDGSSICLSLWATTVLAQGVFIAIERSRDSAGAATADGFLIVFGCQANQNGNLWNVIGNGGSVGAVKSTQNPIAPVNLPLIINGASGSTASTLSKDGVTAPVLPMPCMAPGVPPWVSNVVVAVHPGDAGATSVIQAATINGETRTYRASTIFDQYGGVVGCGTASANRFRPAIAWAV